jgi:hypothetical protein
MDKARHIVRGALVCLPHIMCSWCSTQQIPEQHISRDIVLAACRCTSSEGCYTVMPCAGLKCSWTGYAWFVS